MLRNAVCSLTLLCFIIAFIIKPRGELRVNSCVGEGAYRLSDCLDVYCCAACRALQYTVVFLILLASWGSSQKLFSGPVCVCLSMQHNSAGV